MSTLKNKILAALSQMDGEARNSDVIQKVIETSPGTSRDSVGSMLSQLKTKEPALFAPTERGWVALASASPQEAAAGQVPEELSDPLEKDLYEPVQRFLLTDEIVTRVEIVGSSRSNKKWGNPDLFGIIAPTASDLYRFSSEFISFEVKRDLTQLIVAFGQAASYRLFSHQSYLVIPRDEKHSEYRRVDALCELFGIGLIDFVLVDEEPIFRVRLRPRTQVPNPSYLNDFLAKLRDSDKAMLNKILG